jgi:uncharacterized protein YecT (DUF1311 family)
MDAIFCRKRSTHRRLSGKILCLSVWVFFFPTVLSAETFCDPKNFGQSDMTACAYKDFEAADKRLGQLYQHLMSKFETQPERAGQLKDAQSIWKQYRDKQCAFNTADTIGGSVHQQVFFLCLADLTEFQAKILAAQADCPEGDLSCVR